MQDSTEAQPFLTDPDNQLGTRQNEETSYNSTVMEQDVESDNILQVTCCIGDNVDSNYHSQPEVKTEDVRGYPTGDVGLPDDIDGNDGFFNRFYFESDHLALKNNSDYQVLLQALAVLEAQRHQAVKGLEELQKEKANALEDPIVFVESLQSENPPKLPKRQLIAKVPQINWLNYLTASDLLKLPAGFQINTRRSFKTEEDNKDEEMVNKDVVAENTSQFEIFERSQDQAPNELDIMGGHLVRGRLWNENKSTTFNQLWTVEEQERLEKLLQVYPPEEIESRRYEKVARALGNRTSKQVASRVQKYFLKLARAGLPVPGRVPHFYQKKAKMNPYSYRNSTFFPSWRPSVFMPEDDDRSSVTSAAEDFSYVSDDESIPPELRDTEEYQELMELKKLKRQKEQTSSFPVTHRGYMCDLCGMDPLVGTRWHCLDCPKETTIDFCNNCIEKNVPQNSTHKSSHQMIAVHHEESTFVDGDYIGFEPEGGTYNYLDPNFLPDGK